MFPEAIAVLTILDEKRLSAQKTQGSRPLSCYSKACLDLRETILSTMPVTINTVPLLQEVGLSYDRQRYFDRAAKILQEVCLLERRYPQWHGFSLLMTLHMLQTVYLEQEKLDKSAAVGKEALAVVGDERADFKQLKALTELRLAETLLKLGKPAEAQRYYEQGLAVIKPDGDFFVWCNINLGSIYCSQARWSDVERQLKTGLDFCDRANLSNRMKAITLINMGWLFHHQRQYALAVPRFKWAIRLMGDSAYTDLSTTGLLDGLIDSLRHLHKYDEANDYVRQALAVQDKAGKSFRSEVAWTRMMLAMILSDKGNRSDAQSIIEDSIEVRKKCNGADDMRAATGTLHLGLIYLQDKKIQQAESCFTECVDIASRHITNNNPTFLMDASNGLAAALTCQHKFGQAQSALERSLSACSEDCALVNVPLTTLQDTADHLLNLYKLQKKDVASQAPYRKVLSSIDRRRKMDRAKSISR